MSDLEPNQFDRDDYSPAEVRAFIRELAIGFVLIVMLIGVAIGLALLLAGAW